MHTYGSIHIPVCMYTTSIGVLIFILTSVINEHIANTFKRTDPRYDFCFLGSWFSGRDSYQRNYGKKA